MSFKLLCSSLPPVRLLQTETERPRARWIRFLGLPPSTDGLGSCSCRAQSCCLLSARTALRFNWHMLLHLIYIMWLMIPLLNAPSPRVLSLSHMEEESTYYSQFFFSLSLLLNKDVVAFSHDRSLVCVSCCVTADYNTARQTAESAFFWSFLLTCESKLSVWRRTRHKRCRRHHPTFRRSSDCVSGSQKDTFSSAGG